MWERVRIITRIIDSLISIMTTTDSLHPHSDQIRLSQYRSVQYMTDQVSKDHYCASNQVLRTFLSFFGLTIIVSAIYSCVEVISDLFYIFNIKT